MDRLVAAVFALSLIACGSSCESEDDPPSDALPIVVDAEASADVAPPPCGHAGEACCAFECLADEGTCVREPHGEVYRCFHLPINPGECGDLLEACCEGDVPCPEAGSGCDSVDEGVPICLG